MVDALALIVEEESNRVLSSSTWDSERGVGPSASEKVRSSGVRSGRALVSSSSSSSPRESETPRARLGRPNRL